MEELSLGCTASREAEESRRSNAKMSKKLRAGSPELSQEFDTWVSAVCAGSKAESYSSLVARLIREAKAALVDEKAQVALIMADSASEVVLVLSPAGIISKASSMSSNLLGWGERNIVGLPIDSLLNLRYLGVAESTDEMARAEHGESVHSTRLHVRHDGSTFEAEHTVLALVGPLGEVSGFARTIRNVSDRVLHETRIDELNLSVALLI